MGATAFYGNSWAWAAVFLLLAVLWARKAGQLVTPSARKFLGNSVASKSCDVGTTIFEAKALTLATVSQVSAMQALNPLVLLVVTATVQIVFKVHLAEKLDRANLAWKASMAALLVTGGFMVR